ncbi:MAG TPA: GDP-mannose 4,6-dehydratase [bacterium]|nr:GDP-mannose 4,6-dehydratase [bacterium]HOL47308.1 GDP-mannose 4,6-dehydratase [bacterium]HPQ17645.1 GDP-mannose 4,6-dehydratase [bacterium]
MKRKIFISGVSGFVGKYLVELLDDENNEITGIDINDNKYIKTNKANFLFQKIDLLDFEKINKLINFSQPDYIYHLAGISFVPFSVKNSETTYKINFLGTYNILESANKLLNKPKVLVVSSGDIYKINDNQKKIKESDKVLPTTPYAVSKYCSEILAQKYFNIDKLPLVIVRPFNHTGPFQREEFAPISFAKQIVQIVKGQKRDYVEAGNIDVWRDYTDVRDVVKAYKLLIELGNGEIYNVCSGQAISIEYIIKYFISKTNKEIKIRINDALFRTNINKYVCGDNTKICLLGWKPEIPITKTFDDIYNYYQTIIQ